MRQIPSLFLIIGFVILFSLLAPYTYAAGYLSPSDVATIVTVDDSDVVITINNTFSSKQRFENMFFLGGDFTKVQIDANPVVSKENFAVFDIQARKYNGWNPQINAPVNAMLVDENLLYVGGSFTQVDEVSHPYLVVFDLSTDTLVDTDLVVNGPVRSIIKQNGKIVISAQTSPSDATLIQVVATSALAGSAVDVNDDLASELMIRVDELGFKIPTLSDLLTFIIRAFFAIAGLTAMFYLLLGAFSWITSGGDKDSVQVARGKIQAAIIGVILMVVVLGIVWTLEQVVFSRKICFGISCPVSIPSLVKEI